MFHVWRHYKKGLFSEVWLLFDEFFLRMPFSFDGSKNIIHCKRKNSDMAISACTFAKRKFYIFQQKTSLFRYKRSSKGNQSLLNRELCNIPHYWSYWSNLWSWHSQLRPVGNLVGITLYSLQDRKTAGSYVWLGTEKQAEMLRHVVQNSRLKYYSYQALTYRLHEQNIWLWKPPRPFRCLGPCWMIYQTFSL